MKLKGFLAGVVGGAVAAAAVLLVALLAFDMGGVTKTVVETTPGTPAAYTTPTATAAARDQRRP